MTLDELSTWLDAYGRAWEEQDAKAFAALFSEDAVYQWGPFSEPLRGRDEIELRVRDAFSRQADVSFGHEPLAVTGDGRGVSRWWVSYRVREADVIEEDEGVFLITIGRDGGCTEFREWWNARTVPLAP